MVVRVRNPHGKGTWTGSFDVEINEKCGYDPVGNPGEFLIPFSKYLALFEVTAICYLSSTELQSESHKLDFNAKQLKTKDEKTKAFFKITIHEDLDLEQHMFIAQCWQQGN